MAVEAKRAANTDHFSTASVHSPQSTLFGLKNRGNTCFLNAVLQCLLRTAPILRTGHRCDTPQFCAFCALKRLSRCSGGSVLPMEFLTNLTAIGQQFKLGRQEDAHEFLTCLMGKLEPRDCLRQVMEGSIASYLQCLECGYSSRTTESFWDLSLELSACTLTRCLRKFCSEEVLEANRFSCPQCRNVSTCTKQLTIATAPQVLILHFKRFTNQGEKNKKTVTFPLALGLDTADGSKVRYSLYGVIVHDGQSCASGHYFSYVRWEDGTWYEVNDSKVIQKDVREATSQGAAYILFYQRQDKEKVLLSRVKRSRPEEPFSLKLKKRACL